MRYFWATIRPGYSSFVLGIILVRFPPLDFVDPGCRDTTLCVCGSLLSFVFFWEKSSFFCVFLFLQLLLLRCRIMDTFSSASCGGRRRRSNNSSGKKVQAQVVGASGSSRTGGGGAGGGGREGGRGMYPGCSTWLAWPGLCRPRLRASVV